MMDLFLLICFFWLICILLCVWVHYARSCVQPYRAIEMRCLLSNWLGMLFWMYNLWSYGCPVWSYVYSPMCDMCTAIQSHCFSVLLSNWLGMVFWMYNLWSYVWSVWSYVNSAMCDVCTAIQSHRMRCLLSNWLGVVFWMYNLWLYVWSYVWCE